ncbi:MAG: outer membrane protein Iml2/Tetratricopeptide repeat protein 39 [Benjaminiella poitrasii]|nr:MAG: outer membrane protein Iml2/Tetratricopeptide repeat protein 39 [Benjaminiella poitrasii]
MFRHISKLTTSTLKYTTLLFSQPNDETVNPKLVETWLKEVHLGLDNLLNDRILEAEDMFTDKHQDAANGNDANSNQHQSPFHIFGHALVVYIQAILSMERSKIDEATALLLQADVTLKRAFGAFKETSVPLTPSSSLVTQRRATDTEDTSSSTYHSPLKAHSAYHRHRLLVLDEAWADLQVDLLRANCILMSATLQFFKTNWIGSLKAVYDLRKALKIYERLFEKTTGLTIVEYEAASSHRLQRKENTQNSLFRTLRRASSYGGKGKNLNDVVREDISVSSLTYYIDTLEYGSYFGISILHVLLSLLPAKVGKLLSSLGINSSRYTAVDLLRKASQSQTMYASLSSLVLLVFYTGLSVYVQPQINPYISFEDARSILDILKLKYPDGQFWQLFAGRFKQMERKLEESIRTLKHIKKPADTIKSKTVHDVDLKSCPRNTSIMDCVQFRFFIIYEIGWSYILHGDYIQATEAFFCIESMSNWSQVFYHFASTCCMIANRLYDKAALEVHQMINMLDQKRKAGGRISSDEFYAEAKLKSWISLSTIQDDSDSLALTDVLQYRIVNPVWELIYLWGRSIYWDSDVASMIKERILKEHDSAGKTKSEKYGMECLLLGVIYRDVDKDIDLAIEYFGLILKQNESMETIKNDVLIPHAAYEMAVTYCMLLKSYTFASQKSECKETVNDYIRCIKDYCTNSSCDFEWESRMQLKCQLLLETCNKM